ncbi:MAG: Hsp70 family protein [Clostridiales bacterium]|jgi:molecular chaperone DnaK|nr:Hsp70 family protein [Clostridiales bacterium]
MNWESYRKSIEEKSGLPEEWYILGIDLGTTNSVISYWDNTSKKPEPIDISNGFGKIPLPSVVQFREDEDDADGGEWVIGEEAFRSIKIYPETTVRSIKRKMGTNETVAIDGKAYLPEEISAKILRELVDHCQGLNPKAEIAGLVVSVPYDFDDAAKKATMRACEIAGLSESLICLIEEPKAAALAYNFRHQLSEREKIMVFDFGGGTLDITLFHVLEKTEKYIKLQVISEGGEAFHGGDNIDELLAEKCFEFIKNKTNQEKDGISIENQVELALRAREAKERLSGVKSFRIPFTFCIPPFVENITREVYEALIGEFIEKTRKLVLKALREAYTGALYPDHIDRVLLEGGSSQMPWVKDMLIGIFNDENKIYTSERPALDISLGATYYAAMKMGLLSQPEMETEKLSVEFEVTVPHDIGLEVSTGARKSFFTMIRRGTPYALAKKSSVFTLSGTKPEDMTTFDLTILERIDKEDGFENCKRIGNVLIQGLPERPSGKTRLKITLLVEEDGGLVKGNVEDIGYGDEIAPSGFKQDFEPDRFKNTIVDGK